KLNTYILEGNRSEAWECFVQASTSAQRKSAMDAVEGDTALQGDEYFVVAAVYLYEFKDVQSALTHAAFAENAGIETLYLKTQIGAALDSAALNYVGNVSDLTPVSRGATIRVISEHDAVAPNENGLEYSL